MTKLICITGARHIGKTTVLETLIPAIIRNGYTVAAVKYSTHAHELDTPGKNSWRLKKSRCGSYCDGHTKRNSRISSGNNANKDQ